MWNKVFFNTVTDKQHLFVQAFCAFLFVALVLWLLDLSSPSVLLWSAGAGALSSSSFIVFGIPHSPTSKPSRIVRGYIIAIIVGSFFGWILQILCPYFCTNGATVNQHLFWLSSSIAVGVSMILMVLFKGEHPPAAGVCLVLVIDIRQWLVVMVIVASASFLALIRHFFARQLRNYL